MAWKPINDLPGQLFVPEFSHAAPRKKPCPDCLACQLCAESRCAACRRRKKGACCRERASH